MHRWADGCICRRGCASAVRAQCYRRPGENCVSFSEGLIPPLFMRVTDAPEYWLRGPVQGISPFLQPVAHAILQARLEIRSAMDGFPDILLWERPAGVASPGFHLQHLAGVLDRLFTYARGEALSPDQLAALAAEEKPRQGRAAPEGGVVKQLVDAFSAQVDIALVQLKATPERTLTEPREVGRARLPSTVLGLLFHAAEHTQRHTGQLLVTARVLL
jgi:DinB superfamily